MSKLKKSVQNIFRTSVIIAISLLLPHGAYNSKCNDKDLLCEDNKSVVCEREIENEEQSETVYITKTGKCYHKKDCACLKKSKIEISKDQAKNNEYVECSKCFG